MEEKEVLEVNDNKNNEKKSSIVGVLITVLVIVGLMVGAYYLLNKKGSSEVENGEKNGDKNPVIEKLDYEKWNGVYKNDAGNTQILLFTKDGKVGSLKVANELMINEKKELIYSINYEDAMTFKDGKMIKTDDEGEEAIFTLELNGDQVTIKYSGDPEQEDGYKAMIGTFKRVKEVKSASSDEFIK